MNLRFFRQIFTDSVVYGGADLLTKMLSFFTFPLLAAALSPKAFGVLDLIITITGLLGLFINFGLNNAVSIYYWDVNTTNVTKPVIVTSGLVAQTCFGFLAIGIGLAVIPFILPKIKILELPITWVSLVAALLFMAFSQWSQYILDVLRLHFAPWRFFLLAIITRVVSTFIGLIAVVRLSMGIDGLLLAQTIVLMLTVPLSLWMIRTDFKPASIDYQWMKQLVLTGYPYIYAGFAFWLFGSIDRWMLATMTSVEEVGIYSVAFRFASFVMFVSAAFGKAWSPLAFKVKADHPQEYSTIYGDVLLLLIYVMLLFGGGMALFSGEIINLLMPDEYLRSGLPLAILCIGIVVQSTQQVTGIGISLEKKTYLFGRLAWITAGLNFVLNWLFIPTYGATGSASATLISYLFLTGSYMYYTQQLHPVTVNWKRFMVLLAFFILITIVSIMFISESLVLSVIFSKVIFVAVSFLVVWRFLPIPSLKEI
ncbi:MAG: oligosaccharide flippase family protein [Anaerolineales bacterium]|jgi:O-antigen/teichoic acid export membrane protein|nr:oligosaccharide flippase family protein [Anaerolineales bacterium]